MYLQRKYGPELTDAENTQVLQWVLFGFSTLVRTRACSASVTFAWEDDLVSFAQYTTDSFNYFQSVGAPS